MNQANTFFVVAFESPINIINVFVDEKVLVLGRYRPRNVLYPLPPSIFLPYKKKHLRDLFHERLPKNHLGATRGGGKGV